MITVEKGLLYNVIETDESFEKYFDGYEKNIRLQADKQTIVSDGVDKAVVTASIFNYLGVAVNDYNGVITFELAGVQHTENAMNGICSIEITSAFASTLTVRAYAEKLGEGVISIESK